MDEKEKEKFREQLESYKKELGFTKKEIAKNGTNKSEKSDDLDKSSLSFDLPRKKAEKITKEIEKKIEIETKLEADDSLESYSDKLNGILKNKEESSLDEIEENPLDDLNSNTSEPVIITKEKKKKKNILYFLFPILIVVILGFLYYNYIFNAKEQIAIDINSLEKQQLIIDSMRTDSINNFEIEFLKLKNDSIELFTENNKIVKLQDTIYNIISANPDGFYLIIGSFEQYNSAKIMQKNNPTIFKSYIFDGNVKRVSLFIGNEESKALENLEIIRYKYPDAWILYNKNLN